MESSNTCNTNAIRDIKINTTYNYTSKMENAFGTAEQIAVLLTRATLCSKLKGRGQVIKVIKVVDVVPKAVSRKLNFLVATRREI